jgi:hypothetical protein
LDVNGHQLLIREHVFSPFTTYVIGLDVHFISSLPVGSQPACMAWEDRKRAQSVEGGG